MAEDGFDVAELRPLEAEQLEMDRQEIFADDMEIGAREQMMDVGDPSGEGVLDRNHAKLRLAVGDGAERVLERIERQRLPAPDVRSGKRYGNLRRVRPDRRFSEWS